MPKEEKELICKYCKREWQPWDKFYNMECCVVCHNQRKDRENRDQEDNIMKCVAAKKWEKINEKVVTTQTCQNKATHLIQLKNKGHWVNEPYCDDCAFWMMSAVGMFNLPIEVKEI